MLSYIPVILIVLLFYLLIEKYSQAISQNKGLNVLIALLIFSLTLYSIDYLFRLKDHVYYFILYLYSNNTSSPLNELPIILLICSAILVFLNMKRIVTKLFIIVLLIFSVFYISSLLYLGTHNDKNISAIFSKFKISHDFTHYYLGAKYPELGYFDFYKNLIAVGNLDTKGIDTYRVLREPFNLQVIHEKEKEEAQKKVRQTLGNSKYQELKQDIEFLYANNSPLNNIVKDHGFNGTPFWVALQQINPFLYGKLSIPKYISMCFLDLLLIIIIIVLLRFTFNLNLWSTLLITSVFLNIEGYRWILASLFRLDWLVTLTIAILCIKEKKYFLSGFALALSCIIRIFPVILVFSIFLFWISRCIKLRKLKTNDEFLALISFTVFLIAFIFIGEFYCSWSEWFQKNYSIFVKGYLAGNNASLKAQYVFLLHKYGLIAPESLQEIFRQTNIIWLSRIVILVSWFLFLRNKDVATQIIFWLIAFPGLLESIHNYYFLMYCLILGYLYCNNKRVLFSILCLLLAVQYLGVDNLYNQDPFLLSSSYSIFMGIFLFSLAIEHYRGKTRIGKSEIQTSS